MLAGEARGLPILDPVLAWMKIDILGVGETATGIFALYGGFLVFLLLGTRCFAYAKRFDAAPASGVFPRIHVHRSYIFVRSPMTPKWQIGWGLRRTWR